MKKLSIIAAFALASALSFTSCKKAEKPAESTGTAKPESIELIQTENGQEEGAGFVKF